MHSYHRYERIWTSLGGRAYQFDAACERAVDRDVKKNLRVGTQLRLVLETRDAATRETELLHDAHLGMVHSRNIPGEEQRQEYSASDAVLR